MSAIGIDIGGTNTRLVAMDREAKVIGRTTLKTGVELGPQAALDRMIDIARVLAQRAGQTVEAVGIGVTGPVDPATGVVDNPHTLGGWPPTELKAPFQRAFGCPVVVDNDANMAAVGEWSAGAARGHRRVAMVTIGTGIGVAALLDGVVQRHVDGRHGEAGHMVLDSGGPDCYCGAKGCWEALASGTALGRAAAALAEREGGLLLELAGGDPHRADSHTLFEAARRGDAAAGRLVEQAGRWIGIGLVNLACVLTPDIFVIGGGVSAHLARLRPAIEATLRRHGLMIPTDVPVVAASLGDDAGPIGAARIAHGAMASRNPPERP